MKRFGSGGTPRFQFPADKYGGDELGRFLSSAALVCLLLAVVGPKSWKSLAAICSLGLLAWCYSRIFSRNVTKRREENDRFLQRKQSVSDWLSIKWACIRQSRDYAFFRCPGCGRTVRVPRRKGHIRITCPHCGFTFDKKT